MAHTQAIDEATPAGTDSASGGAAQFRNLKRDIRQRMELQHYWNDALTGAQEDGKHINITIGGTGVVANTALIAAAGGSLTGSDATSLIDVAGTWNTTGTPTALKVNVTDTASNAASKLLDLQVGGTSKASIDKDGDVVVTGSVTATSVSVTSFTTTNLTATTLDVNGVATVDGLRVETKDKTTAYTMLATDYNVTADASGGAFAVTLIASPTDGQTYAIRRVNSGANDVTIAGNSVNINGVSSIALTSQYESVVLIYNANDGEWGIY